MALLRCKLSRVGEGGVVDEFGRDFGCSFGEFSFHLISISSLGGGRKGVGVAKRVVAEEEEASAEYEVGFGSSVRLGRFGVVADAGCCPGPGGMMRRVGAGGGVWDLPDDKGPRPGVVGGVRSWR